MQKQKGKNHKIAIIGAGSAGIACAVQLKREGFRPTVFEKNNIGGLAVNANLIENLPAFYGSGEDYVRELKKFAKDINVVYEEVTSLECPLTSLQGEQVLSNPFLINDKYEFNIVVIATGTKPKFLRSSRRFAPQDDVIHYDLKNLKHLKDKHIAIVGAGDAAFDYALNLAKNNNVTILNRGTKIKALKLLQDRVFRNEKIKYVPCHSGLDPESNQNIKKALSLQENVGQTPNQVQDDISGMNNYSSFDYILVAIGREPNLDFNVIASEAKQSKKTLMDCHVRHCLPRNDKLKELQQSPFLYTIGDVNNEQFRQISIAIADGIRTAMEISRKIKCASLQQLEKMT